MPSSSNDTIQKSSSKTLIVNKSGWQVFQRIIKSIQQLETKDNIVILKRFENRKIFKKLH